jgi:hypothetical protein
LCMSKRSRQDCDEQNGDLCHDGKASNIRICISEVEQPRGQTLLVYYHLYFSCHCVRRVKWLEALS